MGSTLIIGKALIKRNFKSAILIAIIFTLCLAGLISAFAIQMSTGNVFDKITEENKAPHMIRTYSGQILDLSNMKEFLNDNTLVENYYIQPIGETLDRVKVGKYDDIMVTFEEYSKDLSHDKITVHKGTVKDTPELDEVWISTGLAYKYGIEVGDKMVVNTVEGRQECVVSAVVLDSLYTSSMMNPSRVWVAEGQLSLWSSLNEDENVLLSVRLKDIEQLQNFKTELDFAFPNLISGLTLDYFMIKNSSNVLNDSISMVLLGASILLVLISVGIVFFMVAGEIISDYTYYGVFKGLGFSNSKIKAINFYRYFLLLLGATPFGFVIGGLTTKGIIGQYQKTTGIVGIEIEILQPLIIALVIVGVILFVTINLVTRRLKGLEPSKAIRFGYIKKERNIKRRKMFSNIIADLAFREMSQQPFKSVMKVLIIFALTFMILSISVMSGFMSQGFTSDGMIGLPECEIYLDKNKTMLMENSENIIKIIENEEDVTKVTPAIMSMSGVALAPEEKINLLVYAYNSYTNDLSLEVLEGNNPKNDYEASVSKSVLLSLDKKVGDMITLNIDGNESAFLVTGSFQIISNMGMAVRITKGAYEKLNPNIDYNWFAVNVREEDDIKSVKASLQKSLGGKVTVTIMTEFIDSLMGEIVKGVNILSAILVIIMSLISGASLFNMVQLHVMENKKNYGILKGVGMSRRMLNQVQYLKMIFLTTMGIGIGIAITLLFSPGIIKVFVSSTGLYQVDTRLSLWAILLTVCFSYFISLVSTFLAVRKQGNINLKELIIE